MGLAERLGQWIALVVLAVVAVLSSVAAFRAVRPDDSVREASSAIPSWAASDDRLFDWDGFHERVLSDSFRTLSFDDAVILLGIMFTHRVTPSPELSEIARRVDRAVESIPPRTLEEGSRIAAYVFRLDRRQLLDQFQASWCEAKESPRFGELKDRLRDHRLVGDVVEDPTLL